MPGFTADWERHGATGSGVGGISRFGAHVYFDERPGGSQITWEATFDSRIPLVGRVLQLVMRSMISRAAAAFATEAERRASRGT